MNRRTSLKALSSLPLLALFPNMAQAGKKKSEMELISEKDTLANAMQYKHDASKASKMRSDKKAFCNNCAKYNVCMEGDKDCAPLGKEALKKAGMAPCQIFKGKLVKEKGWCLSWQAKS